MIDTDLARRLATAARKGREWQSRRDALIVKAIEDGASQTEVAKLTGLSQPGVHDIFHRSQDLDRDNQKEQSNGSR